MKSSKTTRIPGPIPGARLALEGITNKASVGCELPNSKMSGTMVLQQPPASNQFVWSLALELEHERRRAAELYASESLEFQIRTEMEDIQALSQLIGSKESRLVQLQGLQQRNLAQKCRDGGHSTCIASSEAMWKWPLAGMMGACGEPDDGDYRLVPAGPNQAAHLQPAPTSLDPSSKRWLDEAKLLCAASARPTMGSHAAGSAQNGGSGDKSHTRQRLLPNAPRPAECEVSALGREPGAEEERPEAKALVVRPRRDLVVADVQVRLKPGLMSFGERVGCYQAAWAESADGDCDEDHVEWQESSEVEEEDIAGIDGSIWEEVYSSFVEGSARKYCEGFGGWASESDDGKAGSGSVCSEGGGEIDKPVCQELASAGTSKAEEEENVPRGTELTASQAVQPQPPFSTSGIEDKESRRGAPSSLEQRDETCKDKEGLKVGGEAVIGEQSKSEKGDWLTNLIHSMEQLHGMTGPFDGYNASFETGERGESLAQPRSKAGRPPRRPPRSARRSHRV